MHSLRVLLLFLPALLVSCVWHDIKKTISCEKSKLELSLLSTTNASTCSEEDGEIRVTAMGGEQPYYFHLNDGLEQSENVFSAIGSGIYNVTVTDKNGCTATFPNIVVSADNFQFTATIMDDTECLNHNGAVTIEVQEGTAPFSYKLNDGLFTANNSFEDLAAGSHIIEVMDAASCSAILNITILQGNTNTSWSTDILPIINTSCSVSSCHDGITRLDYRIYTNAFNHAAEIKSYTADGSMPFDGAPLPKSQIDLIACWVNDGAPNN